MIRYLPPKGTAGLARSRVRGKSRVPFPPASTIPTTRNRELPCPLAVDSCPDVVVSGNQASLNSSAQDVIKAAGVRRFGKPCRRKGRGSAGLQKENGTA